MSEGRILTTHTGSLPRPAALVDLLAARFHGEHVDGEALAALVDAATRDVVRKQAGAGIDIVNDGEQARESFFTYVQHRMTGFGGVTERRLMKDITDFPGMLAIRTARGRTGHVNLMRAPRARGPIAYTEAGRRAVAAEAAAFDRALESAGEAFAGTFMTAASPGIVATAMANDYFESTEAYVDAVADALREEYAAIAARGYTLQIDAPDLAMERHALFQDEPMDAFLAFVEHVITAINRSIADLPRESVRLHVCWGNYEGPHTEDVPLEAVLPLYYRANVGALLISMANPRHEHEYRVFERLRLPDGMQLVAGVVDSTTNYVEHPEVVADRIERVARSVGDPARVMAGPDCGFDTAADFGVVAADVCWAKLRALSDGAAIASRRLFG
jgi:5-methyltetrahydropteroyltriglutamate--homocysteine methyltransferase